MTSSISGNSSYWDIDDILAEEEQAPVTNLLDFRFLAHLDPDYVHISPKARSRSAARSSSAGEKVNGEKSKRNSTKQPKSRGKFKECKLKEGTRFKMPLWSIREWATTGLVHVSFPKHYGRRAREKISAEPTKIDLR